MEKLDTKNAQDTLRVKGEEERKKKATEFDEKKKFETHKTTESIRLEAAKHKNKMKELGAQTMLDAEAENYRDNKNQSSNNKDSSSNQPKSK